MRTPDVWKVDVAAELTRPDAYRNRLDAVELARAARFHRDDDRTLLNVGPSTSRQILARMLGVEPATLSFESDRHGRPRMRPTADAAIHFNSSHSGQWVLHAFADVEIGVDVEQVRAEMAALEDFAWVLSPDERAYVLSAGESLRAAALATVWVRKEAYVKALGQGLSRSLPDIGIVARPDGRPALAFDRNPPSRERRWCFADLAIDAWHKACVVHAGAPGDLVVRDYRPRET